MDCFGLFFKALLNSLTSLLTTAIGAGYRGLWGEGVSATQTKQTHQEELLSMLQ